ncbi:MAG: PQQ-binding-like beta-propeller repeat protein [Pirellulales bacterium]|nr:PQQ-binding-like beta-propeller repeat protein [Pirellulales bacterium]
MIRCIFTCLMTLIVFDSARADQWQPASGRLMTRWAKEVTPENVWPEYPRPQMTREHWMHLNGLWEYAIRPKDSEQPSEWDGQILVPFPVESALSGVMKAVQPDQRLWYRRTFEKPSVPADGHVLLHFGAVDWECTIWVNGSRIGNHRGGYDPFHFDITDALKDGDNELVVSVWDPTDAGYQPRGKQILKPHGIMYTAVTGIWQTVWMEPVPAASIQSVKIVPDIDRSMVTVTVQASTDRSVQISVLDKNTVIEKKMGQTGQAVELPMDQPKLWSPDEPNLYDLKVELVQDGKVTDTVGSYFGMRKIAVAKDEGGIHRLMLNNKVLFQYGPLDQGWWPDGLYTPASDAAMKYDIVMTKQFGMNMARKHVKYECARWYYWCDRLGLFVWQDMPSGDSGKNDESKANFRKELQAMIDTLQNHPCIVMWVPFNEGWGQHDTREIVNWIEKYDPTRPVNEASGWTDQKSGTVSDMHSYPGPGMRPVEENRVIVLGEFGGLGMPVRGHCWQDEKNWGYVSFKNSEELTDAYVGLLTAMRPLIDRGLAAAVYTQTTDVEIEVNGLMTYDRAMVKMDLERIAEAARRLYLPPPVLKTLVPTSQVEPQTWRYTIEKPGADWSQPGFEDSSWKEAPGGFGTRGTPGAVVGTEWKSPDIWIRRTFTLDSLPTEGTLCLSIHHDEDAEIYLNGQLVKARKGYVTDYIPVPLNAVASKFLNVGKNTISVHCHQTGGGQFIDVGLMLQIEKEAIETSVFSIADQDCISNSTKPTVDEVKGNHWPCFRGSGGMGVSDATGLPLEWDESKNVVWKTALPGAGASSPITFGEHIYLTAYTGYYVPGGPRGSLDQLKRHLIALRRDTGEIVWDQAVPARLPEEESIREHGYAANTPAADAERVYAFFGKTGVFAFDHQGQQLWQSDVGSETSGWGSAASVLLYKDLVIINASVESESLVALDRTTGEEKWRATGIRNAWNTPIIVTSDSGREELMVARRGDVLAFDPDLGTPLWTCKTDITWYMVPTGVAGDGVIYYLGGRSGIAALAVRAGGSGDVTATHRLWTSKNGTNVPSPIYLDGYLYWMSHHGGIAYCAKGSTGELVYEERLGNFGQVYASPVLVERRLVFFDRNGKSVVLAAKPEFEQLAMNVIKDPTRFDASPAVDGNRLLVRSGKFLYCLGE